MAVEMTVEQVDALEAEWRALHAQAMALYRKLRRVRKGPSPEDRVARWRADAIRRGAEAAEAKRKNAELDALLAELRATGLSGKELWEKVAEVLAERVSPVTA